MNKVKFGLKNVYYSKYAEDDAGVGTYAPPKRMLGGVSLSMQAQGDSVEFYADDILFYSTAANQGYQGDLEMAMIHDDFREDILGETVDTDSGVRFENAAVEPAKFALLFEFSGDANATRHILYMCTATRPNISGQTTTKSKEPQTETITITAAPRTDGYVKASTTDKTKAETYQNWYKSVLLPPSKETASTEEQPQAAKASK